MEKVVSGGKMAKKKKKDGIWMQMLEEVWDHILLQYIFSSQKCWEIFFSFGGGLAKAG